MGSGSSKPDERQEARRKYMQMIRERKRRYARQNSDWKEPALQALSDSEREVDWSYWPQDIRRFVCSWHSNSDSKWRSNVLWFDYLRSYKSDTHSAHTPTFSTLRIPIIPLFSSDMQAKSLVDYLRAHFVHADSHAIAGMIRTFAESFGRFYVESASSFLAADSQLTIDILDFSDFKRVVAEVKTFLKLAIVCAQSYYSGICSIFAKEKNVDLRDLLVDQIMHTQVHDILLHIFAIANREKEDQYQHKLKSLSSLQCSDFAIDPLFCIDQRRASHPDPAGYKAAIDCLREVSVTHSPAGKVDVIIQTTRRICECVDEYWKDDQDITPSQLVINADQILGIFVYLVVKAKVRNLMGHVNLIFDFVRTEVQQGTYGYYVATLEASIEHILLMEGCRSSEHSGSQFTAEGD